MCCRTKVSKYLQLWQEQGTAFCLQSGLALFHKPEETISSSQTPIKEDHFIHVPAVPFMSKKQTYFKDKNSLQHMPTVSSNNL